MFILLVASTLIFGTAAAFTQQAKIVPSAGSASMRFASSVAIDGNTVIGGAPYDEPSHTGSATLFVRNSGAWTEQQRLVAPDGAVDDYFGYAVALRADVALVSAPRPDGIGCVHVFKLDNESVWTHRQQLSPSDGAIGDFFGFSLEYSRDGATLLVGSRSHATSGTIDTGAVYVFAMDGGGEFAEVQKLVPDEHSLQQFCGNSISLDGDTLIIGCDGDDHLGSKSGSAYVWARGGDGVWREQQRLIDTDGSSDDQFGTDVSVLGDLLVVGEPGDDGRERADNDFVSRAQSGALLFFERTDNGTWAPITKHWVSDAAAGDVLGRVVVAVRPDLLLASAPLDDTSRLMNSGSVYVLQLFDSSRWITVQKIVASDASMSAVFGSAISVSGNTACISAVSDDDRRGAVYVFTEPPPPTTTTTATSAPSTTTAANDDEATTTTGDGTMAVSPGDDPAPSSSTSTTMTTTVDSPQQPNIPPPPPPALASSPPSWLQDAALATTLSPTLFLVVVVGGALLLMLVCCAAMAGTLLCRRRRRQRRLRTAPSISLRRRPGKSANNSSHRHHLPSSSRAGSVRSVHASSRQLSLRN